MTRLLQPTHPRVVAVISGGMDSTTLLYDLMQEYTVHAISFDYGQRHIKELAAARLICLRLGVEHKLVSIALGGIFTTSALTNKAIDVPEGHYTDRSMKQTIVPNRNAIILSIAYGWAVALNAHAIATAVHAGDHAIYPDCRLEFIEDLETALMEGNDSAIEILAPYIDKTKADIAKLGSVLGVPFEHTWSCYKGGELHCGKCGTCVERREAFKLAHVTDPTEYEATK